MYLRSPQKNLPPETGGSRHGRNSKAPCRSPASNPITKAETFSTCPLLPAAQTSGSGLPFPICSGLNLHPNLAQIFYETPLIFLSPGTLLKLKHVPHPLQCIPRLPPASTVRAAKPGPPTPWHGPPLLPVTSAHGSHSSCGGHLAMPQVGWT